MDDAQAPRAIELEASVQDEAYRIAAEAVRAAREGPSKPVTRLFPDRWLRNAGKRAGLEPQRGSAWHAFRRGWATARKHLPAVDVAKGGGWATVAMVADIYQQADQETTLQVVLGGAQIREVGGR